MKQRVARALLVLSALSRAAAAQRQVSQVRDRFADLPEARLDSLYGPLLYLMHPDERGVYPALSVSGKRDNRKSTRLNSSHLVISYAVFCLKKKNAEEREFVGSGVGPRRHSISDGLRYRIRHCHDQ